MATWEDAELEKRALRGAEDFDECLAEMVHRGGRWESILRFMAEQEPARDVLKVLTALRRLEGRPDPLTVVIESEEFHSTWPEYPMLSVSVTNVDVDRRAVEVRNGGWTRWGRMQGKEVAVVRKPPRSGFGGGFSIQQSLQPGERVTVSVDLGDFITPLKPARYRLRIEYSDDSTLANGEDQTGRIVFTGTPVEILITPRLITVSREDAARLLELIKNVDESQPLKVLEGPWPAYERHPLLPQMAATLVDEGWLAVPPLLEALEGQKLTPAKRAWLLSLLFTITGEGAPRRHPGAYGPHTFMSQGRSVMTKEGVGSILPGAEWNESDRLDVDAQHKLVLCWRDWKKALIVNGQ